MIPGESRERRGLTLTEAVLAIALLGSCLLGLLTVMVGGLGLSARNQQTVEATELAREELETIKERGYTWPPPGASYFDGRTNRPPIKGFPPAPYPCRVLEGRKYTVVVSVNDVAPLVRSVRVQVLWDERREVSLETYLHP